MWIGGSDAAPSRCRHGGSGGGLGQFAITYGYQKFNWSVTLVAVVTIIILVQFAQFLGNWLARRALRR